MYTVLYLESGCELRDKPYDFVVLDIVVSVLHEISPQNLFNAQTEKRKTRPITNTQVTAKTSIRAELQAVYKNKDRSYI